MNCSSRSLRKRIVTLGDFGFDWAEIAFFAAGDEAFGDGFQFLPAVTDLFGLGGSDLIIRRGGGDDLEQVGEFLDDLVGGGNEEMGMRCVLGIIDKKATGTLAEPLDEAMILGALKEGLDSVERVFHSGAAFAGRLGPFVDHGGGEFQVGGNLLGRLFLKRFLGAVRVIPCGHDAKPAGFWQGLSKALQRATGDYEFWSKL